MRNLLQDSDRDRLVAPLAGPLVGAVELDGRRHMAVAETLGSGLYPVEAAALAAELLLQPGLREAHGPLGDALLDFVMAMSDAPVPSRRAVAGGLLLQSDAPEAVAVLTPFCRLSGNLMRGELVQELRGGRAAIRHSGNLVEFSLGHRRFCVDVEDNVTAAEAVPEGDAIVLRQVSTIRATAGLLWKRSVEAGSLELRYVLRADSPVLGVTARFTAARRLTRLRISTAADGLDEGGLGATAARLQEGEAWREATPPAAPGATRWAEGTPVAHLALGAAGWARGAPVLHLRPRDPARVMSVTAQAARGGALRWLLLRHGPVTLRAGESLVVEEERLLAPGDPAMMAAAMARGAKGLDLDAAPPSGAVLQAVAAALLLDAGGAWAEGLDPERRARLRDFAARHAARLEASAMDATELAWTALAADTLRRAGEHAAAAMQAGLLDRLASLSDAEGLVRAPGEAPSLAAQALAILAFARGAAWPDGGAALGTLAALLGAITAEPGSGLRFAGAAPDAAEEPEALALLARAAGAAVLAAEAGARLPDDVIARAREIHRMAVTLLRPLVRPRLGTLEVVGRDGVAGSLQALTTLALLAPDRLALECRPTDAATA
ncbi:hypothetical protein DFH01_05620 [Falsiroseomonas bella]|uniref:Uncharacterized protein n=1 Tax=Falsiroseomonas bella TaxID=2184016 RepID=A0A317FMA2_9PROT|nr:hypothetical protein [Falsiroseomonas bella]PWS38736.1 hypothetical protein DFH01_05620 [Falsiroseomonas bella]